MTDYVNNTVRNDARELFALLLGNQPDDVPDSLLDLWDDTRRMVYSVYSGPFSVAEMAMLVQIDRYRKVNTDYQNARKAIRESAKTKKAY